MSFAAAEARATAACMNTQGIAHQIIYRPRNGSPVATTAIIEDERITLGDEPVQGIETRTIMRVFVSVVPRALRGDEIEELTVDADGNVIGSKFWTVELDMRRDNLLAHLVVMPR